MSVTKHRLRRLAAVALVATVALGTAAACSKTVAPGAKPDKLVVDTFGEFGYDDLVKQYEAQTGIKVELRKTAQLGDYRPKLVRYLATGKGAGDVVALEEGILNEFKINPANWVDLAPLVGDLSGNYLPWKWELGKAPDGKLIGLPTDVGSLAVCYRRDLFQAAGLETERDKVSAMWPTWDKFIETATKYRTATGKGLLDSVTTAASAVTVQIGGESLTNADSQVAAFKPKGPLPTNLTALQNPDFQGFQNAYFNNAPTGKIFGESVAKIKPLVLGPKHTSVKERAMEPALQALEQGKISEADAWKQFLNDMPIQGAH